MDTVIHTREIDKHIIYTRIEEKKQHNKVFRVNISTIEYAVEEENKKAAREADEAGKEV